MPRRGSLLLVAVRRRTRHLGVIRKLASNIGQLQNAHLSRGTIDSDDRFAPTFDYAHNFACAALVWTLQDQHLQSSLHKALT